MNRISCVCVVDCSLDTLSRSDIDDRPMGEGGSEKEEEDDRKNTKFHARVRYIKENDSRMCYQIVPK